MGDMSDDSLERAGYSDNISEYDLTGKPLKTF